MAFALLNPSYAYYTYLYTWAGSVDSKHWILWGTAR